MDLIYTRRQYHQCYTLIKCETIFTSQLSTIYNHTIQGSVLLSISDKSKIPTKLYSSKCLHPLMTLYNPCFTYMTKCLKPFVLHIIKDKTNNTEYWNIPLTAHSNNNKKLNQLRKHITQIIKKHCKWTGYSHLWNYISWVYHSHWTHNTSHVWTLWKIRDKLDKNDAKFDKHHE